MSRKGRAPSASRHLLFKGLTGFLLGFPLALWLSWLLMYGGLLPGFVPVRDQIAMWLAVLLWACAPCVAFLAASRVQCATVFLLANVAAFAAWRALQ
ncbi:hypothetical protein [Paracidovorax wautersii]|uniref:Uncharacterized protein n=1 Tax=Paracidovorax wautersii TaxID=1177982 RepID=A0A1I2EGQ3_9BURK|nr:hypothetical protein [Paracidovorax wautersii]SFE91863.1 hypothetical protein SAMN04489711_107100 [Paracidovorax wautersii]